MAASARRTTTTTTVEPTAPASTSPPAPPPPSGSLVPGRVTVVGDSVTIDAAPDLESILPGCRVDANVGEQWYSGIQQLQQLRQKGQLGGAVVVALGTNGPVTGGDFVQMMGVLKGVGRVVIVTDHGPVSWVPGNNALFKEEVPRYPNARIADWDAVATAHPSWFYSDGVHMPIGGVGAHAFAEVVRAALTA